MGLLTSGRSTNCGADACSGGIADDLYLANACEVDSVQIDGVSGKATGITMVDPANVFYPYDFRDYTAVFNETLTVNQENGNISVEQTFTMIWPCRNHADRTLIMDMAQNSGGMVAIHGENTGIYWIWGYLNKRRVKMNTNEGTSGTALTDANQETLNLICATSEKAIEWEPGAAGIPLA